MSEINRVLVDRAQDFTEAEKAQGRANIGAQGALSAGANISISDNVISATNTTYVAGTGIAINGNTINCTVDGGSPIYTQNNGQGGIVEHQVSKLSLDTDFQQIIADGNQIGVYAPTPTIAATDKVLTVAAGGDAPVWTDKPSGPDIKTVSTTLPPVETDVSSMTLFDDGRVRVNNSTEVGLLAPTGTQAENGKVLVGSYVGSPGKFVANWGDVSAMVNQYPQIDYMTLVTVNVNLSASNYLNMEDGVCYDVMSNAGGSYTLHLQTNSTTTVHSKIYLWGEQANCMSATIVYEDEGGEVSELQVVYGGTSANTLYALDVYARKVHVSGGISFDAYLCRVYDYPCASRDIGSYNKDIGRVVEYIEPL